MTTHAAFGHLKAQEDAFDRQLLKALNLDETEEEKRQRKEKSWQKLQERMNKEPKDLSA